MPFPLNRQISRRLTPSLAWLGLTPNQVTLLALAAGLASGWMLLQGTPSGWIVGALFFELAYLLDNCDGELARMTRTASGLGRWLDTVTDCLSHIAFFLGLGFGVHRLDPNRLWIRLGELAAVGVFLTYLAFFLQQLQQRGPSAWAHPDPPGRGEPAPSPWEMLRVVLREDFSLVVLGSALLGQMAWLLWGGVLGAFLYLFIYTVSIAVKVRPAR
jgi:phosphatidylglycerophosphate synthase